MFVIWFNFSGLPYNLSILPETIYTIKLHAYGANVPNHFPHFVGYRPDNERNPHRSLARFYENDLELRPAHVDHRVITEQGRGRFSHWLGTIIFSSSDNTNPTVNARDYRIKVRVYPLWSANLALLTFIGALVTMAWRSDLWLIALRSRPGKIIINVGLILFSLVVFFSLLELILNHTTWLDERDNPRPIYIPAKVKAIDEHINRVNRMRAENHRFKFNDYDYPVQKPKGRKRIAVLGDSFIWGDGLEYNDAWGHKLGKMVAKIDPDVEVLNWGLCGWSTKDEYQFFLNHGLSYDVDLLIVAFVTNDPDLGNIKQRLPSWQDAQWYKNLTFVFPETNRFVAAYVNNWLVRYNKDLGYFNWEDKLYSDANLASYSQLLQQFAETCRQHKVDLLFVLTPNLPNERYMRLFSLIKPLLERAGIRYIDTFPAIKRDLSDKPTRTLWANLANGHPGSLVTEVYAREVLQCLIKKGYVQR